MLTEIGSNLWVESAESSKEMKHYITVRSEWDSHKKVKINFKAIHKRSVIKTEKTKNKKNFEHLLGGIQNWKDVLDSCKLDNNVNAHKKEWAEKLPVDATGLILTILLICWMQFNIRLTLDAILGGTIKNAFNKSKLMVFFTMLHPADEKSLEFCVPNI